jgi:hypothetical protein
MAVSERTTVVGVFPDRSRAERAVRDLLNAGFTADQLGLVSRHGAVPQQGSEAVPENSPEIQDVGTVAGGVTGAVVGGLVGNALTALVVAAIPGIGPALAAGIFTVLTTTTGVAGALAGIGMSESEARTYEAAVQAGKTLVAVKVDGRYSEAVALLTEAGAEDVTRRPTEAGAAV